MMKISTARVNDAGRRGIMKPTDQFGVALMLHDHQLVAAMRLLSKELATPFEQRKVAMACLHEMGLGTCLRFEPNLCF
jgi:hypothetical protein